MAYVKIAGGTTPADPNDPRTFPAIYNPLVDGVESLETEITGKADTAHDHDASDVVSGRFTVTQGGTGRSTLTSGSFLVGNAAGQVALRTPAEVLSDIGGVAKSGDTLTGHLLLHADPTLNLHAATKQYVDENGGGVALEVSDTEPTDTEVLWVNDQEGAESPLPNGGTAGELIAKASATDGDVAWMGLELPLAYDVPGRRVYLDMTELLNTQAPLSFDPSTKTLSLDASGLTDVLSPLQKDVNGTISVNANELVHASYPIVYDPNSRTISLNMQAIEDNFESRFGYLETDVNNAIALVDPKLVEVDQAITDMEGAYLPASLVEVSQIVTSDGAVDINFAGTGYREQSITGNVDYTASGYTAGKTITVKIATDTVERNVTFDAAWKFVSEKPELIPADQTAILTLTAFGTTADSCVAAWAVTE